MVIPCYMGAQEKKGFEGVRSIRCEHQTQSEGKKGRMIVDEIKKKTSSSSWLI